ncbi:hypothetical protein, partial [Nocardiopsis sp. NRRL B-16309]|uniref:hypothetical protein n=1 Tax=Nocardiopsis sp. NRRL B-16309 TaxID=1519494 RepID=UPI001E53EF5F
MSEPPTHPDGTPGFGDAPATDNPYVTSFTEELVSGADATPTPDDTSGQGDSVRRGDEERNTDADLDWPLGDLYDTPTPTPQPTNTHTPHTWQPPTLPF